MPAKGIGISPYFKKAAAAAVTPSPLIASWYAALSVKPSSALLTSLNTLVNGMNTDGDWTELDFFSLSAGMETEEQALRPLKTTGSATMTNFDNGGGGLVWTVNGWAANGTDVIKTGLDLSLNSVKFTLNSAFMSFFGNTRTASAAARDAMGVIYNYDDLNEYYSIVNRQRAASSLNINNLNVNTPLYKPDGVTLETPSTATKSGITIGNANVPYYMGNKRTGASSCISFVNGVNGAANTSTTSIIPVGEVCIMGYYNNHYLDQSYVGFTSDYGRASLIGSGNVSQTNTGSRLNTFFVSRSLNPYV